MKVVLGGVGTDFVRLLSISSLIKKLRAFECIKSRKEKRSGNESHSVVSEPVTPWTVLFMEFSRPEYWNG